MDEHAKNLLASREIFHGFLSGQSGKPVTKAEQTMKQEQSSQSGAAPSTPSPPNLHQYFSSQFIFGWGTLVPQNNFSRPNDIFRGQVVVDKTIGGLYYDLHDNQDANVPWLFSTTIISSPNASTGEIIGYANYMNGRCWNLGVTIDPQVPIRIPADATFGGYYTAYGKKVSLWSFSYTTTFAVVNAQIAVSVADNSIVFINLDGDVAVGVAQSYIVLVAFNPKRPNPIAFRPPAGQCPDLFPPP